MAISRRIPLLVALCAAALAGCSVEVEPFPQLATEDVADVLGVADDEILDATVAAELDRNDDGRLDVTAPLRAGIPSFDEVGERLQFDIAGATVCADGPRGVVVAGPC